MKNFNVKSRLIVSAFVFLASISWSVSAQNRRVSLYIFQPHWYLGGHAGVNSFVAEGIGSYSPLESLGMMARISGGYDFSSVFGVRGTAGIVTHTWPDIRTANTIVDFGAQNLNADLTINLSNLIKGYYLARPLDILLYGGAGVTHRNQALFTSDLITYTARAGLQADIHLSQVWDMNLMGEMNISSDNYNDHPVGFAFDLYPTVAIGFTYHFRTSCNVCDR